MIGYNVLISQSMSYFSLRLTLTALGIMHKILSNCSSVIAQSFEPSSTVDSVPNPAPAMLRSSPPDTIGEEDQFLQSLSTGLEFLIILV